jgi:hypothetical protein
MFLTTAASPRRFAALVANLADDGVEAAFDLLQASYHVGHAAVGPSTVTTITTGTVAAVARPARHAIARPERPAVEIWAARRTCSKAAESTRSTAHCIRSSAHSVRSPPRKTSIG